MNRLPPVLRARTAWEPWHSLLVFRVRHILMGSARTKLWRWVVANTLGSDVAKTMVAGLDLKYNSGEQMTNRTRVELPELKPKAQFAVDFDAVAPSKEGTYIMTFVVEGHLCYPYVAIIVEK